MTQRTIPAELNPDDLPGICSAADRASLTGQRRYLRLTKARSLFVIGAAAAGVVTTQYGTSERFLIFFGVVAACAFFAALVVELVLLWFRPDEEWYYCRAVAESVKTLAWLYAMKAPPFAVTDDGEARRLFIRRSREILREVDRTDAFATGSQAQVTQAMKLLRESSFEARKNSYLNGRIRDQRHWYKKKSDQNRKSARLWRWSLLGIEALGGVLAILQVVNVVDVGVEALLAAAVGAIGAWIEVKQFDNLASAYALTSTELALVEEEGKEIQDEGLWGAFVDSAERAISREHTMWLARRTRPKMK